MIYLRHCVPITKHLRTHVNIDFSQYFYILYRRSTPERGCGLILNHSVYYVNVRHRTFYNKLVFEQIFEGKVVHYLCLSAEKYYYMTFKLAIPDVICIGCSRALLIWLRLVKIHGHFNFLFAAKLCNCCMRFVYGKVNEVATDKQYPPIQ